MIPTITQVQEAYDQVCYDLRTLFQGKIHAYGTKRYDDELGLRFNLWMTYSDVYRKFIRLERQIEAVATTQQNDIQDLIETYQDLANYSIMAVQILEQYNELPTDSNKG